MPFLQHYAPKNNISLEKLPLSPLPGIRWWPVPSHFGQRLAWSEPHPRFVCFLVGTNWDLEESWLNFVTQLLFDQNKTSFIKCISGMLWFSHTFHLFELLTSEHIKNNMPRSFTLFNASTSTFSIQFSSNYCINTFESLSTLNKAFASFMKSSNVPHFTMNGFLHSQ